MDYEQFLFPIIITVWADERKESKRIKTGVTHMMENDGKNCQRNEKLTSTTTTTD